MVSNMSYSMYVTSDGMCNRVMECSILMTRPLNQGPVPNITTPLAEYLFTSRKVISCCCSCTVSFSFLVVLLGILLFCKF